MLITNRPNEQECQFSTTPHWLLDNFIVRFVNYSLNILHSGVGEREIFKAWEF